MPITPTLAPLFSSASNEWFTPSPYIEAARAVMGKIDLDPASCAEANRVVGAARYYTREENGLTLPLSGRVWCNPPYGTSRGKSNAGAFAQRLLHGYRAGQVEQAILLVNADTDRKWFQPLWDYPICFTNGRINFLQGGVASQYKYRNTHGSAFVYLGPYLDRFHTYFSPFGPIALRYTPPPPSSNS